MKKNDPSGIPAGAIPRRRFLRQSALAAAGLAAGGSFASGMIRPALRAVPRPAGAAKSKVIWVHNAKVVDAAGKVEAPLLQEMLDKGLTAFTGKGSASDAWRQFVTPEDVVGLKINTLGLQSIRGMDYCQHFQAINDALCAGLRSAGVKDSHLVIWDRSEEEMKEAGLVMQPDAGKVRVIANKPTRQDREGFYDSTSYPVGGKTTRLSAIWTETCTAVINIPVPKTHGGAVFTNALKNHYGTIDNAYEFHANNCCKPGIAEINALAPIRKKQKLVVCDALLMVIENGPRWDRRFIRPAGGLLIGTDPVAIDAVALKMLDEKRVAEGLAAIAPRVAHIGFSEELGLGTAKFEAIDLVKIELG